MSCVGKVYRAEIYSYNHKDTIGYNIRLRLRKNLSCSGCELCGWQYESNDTEIVNITDAEHGKLYTLSICNESLDRETGAVDDYDLQIVEYVPDKAPKSKACFIASPHGTMEVRVHSLTDLIERCRNAEVEG